MMGNLSCKEECVSGCQRNQTEVRVLEVDMNGVCDHTKVSCL